jgi:hypothetical protein
VEDALARNRATVESLPAITYKVEKFIQNFSLDGSITAIGVDKYEVLDTGSRTRVSLKREFTSPSGDVLAQLDDVAAWDGEVFSYFQGRTETVFLYKYLAGEDWITNQATWLHLPYCHLFGGRVGVSRMTLTEYTELLPKMEAKQILFEEDAEAFTYSSIGFEGNVSFSVTLSKEPGYQIQSLSLFYPFGNLREKTTIEYTQLDATFIPSKIMAEAYARSPTDYATSLIQNKVDTTITEIRPAPSVTPDAMFDFKFLVPELGKEYLVAELSAEGVATPVGYLKKGTYTPAELAEPARSPLPNAVQELNGP